MAQRSKNRCRKLIRMFKGQKELCNVPLNDKGECPFHGKDIQ